jgi:glycosyltransferase involved in cell wall biosynthesis
MATRLCVQWPTLGPYHLARVKALADHAERHGLDLSVCETASEDITGRKSTVGDFEFDRLTVFDKRSLADIDTSEVSTRVRRTLDAISPDVVAINSYSFPDARACLRWCMDSGARAILMTDSRKEDAPRASWRERLKSLIVRSFDAAIVAGSPQREYLLDLGFEYDRIFLGYDVVDNDFFARRAAAARADTRRPERLPGLADNTPFFLAAARMIVRKDYPTLIRAYHEYSRQTDNPWRLVVVGDGPLMDEVSMLITQLGVEGITLAGSQSYENMPTYYGRASALVHTATVDQWGLVVNEAMAAGLPVIVSTGTGCARDLVDEGSSGFVFETGNPMRLSELMLRISSDATLRNSMAEESERRIQDWGPDRFAESMIAAARLAVDDAVKRPRGTRFLLSALEILGTSPTSFHTVEP